LTVIISFLLSLLFASLSYRFIEKPVLDLKDRYFSLRQSPRTD
jgi:peptidoglycan/LPS O-acetylase OafA/YrhL